MNRSAIGSEMENIAVKYLIDNGVIILNKNFRTKHGEIDIVGLDKDYLVFFEVRYRNSCDFGHPLETIDARKIRRIINASKVYLYLNKYSQDTLIRFDCIGILEGDISWVKNAFLC